MQNSFNDLLLQTLKEIRIRLDRLEGRVDHIIDQKSDKTDIIPIRTDMRLIHDKADKADLEPIKNDIRLIHDKADKADLEPIKTDIRNILEQKADKADLEPIKTDIRNIHTDMRSIHDKIDQKADKADLEPIKTDIRLIHDKIDQKADKADLNATNQKLDTLDGKVENLGKRMDRLEGGIGTLKWVIGAEVAVIGVISLLSRRVDVAQRGYKPHLQRVGHAPLARFKTSLKKIDKRCC